MIFNRNELRRLEKAAREKDKKHLVEWAKQFEEQVMEGLRPIYEQEYQKEIQSSIDNFVLALCYTLVYTSEWDFDANNIGGFLEDLFVTVDMFRTGEYKPQDYEQDLANHGIKIEHYDYSKAFKDKDKQYQDLVKEYTKKLEEVSKLEAELKNKLNDTI